MKKQFFLIVSVMALAVTAVGGALTDRIAAKYKVKGTDMWYGGQRTVFDFEGYDAWVVEPPADVKALDGTPWTWTIQWRTAYVARTSVPRLLKMGWHHVSVDTFKDKMDKTGLAVSRRFQDFLVKELGFAPKAHLIGMSWGGFFSVRYAANNPDCVDKIYLDAPFLNFDGRVGRPGTLAVASLGPWDKLGRKLGEWTDDPEMPVNMAEKLVAQRIPILLLYGGADQTLMPVNNAELFASRYKKAGGDIQVVNRTLYGHHPHGVDVDENTVINFFSAPRKGTVTVKMLPEERWWGGANYFGPQMPFTAKTDLVIDLTKTGYYNQYASFMISDKGREIWCDRQCRFEIRSGRIVVSPEDPSAKVEVKVAGKTLRDAFLYASKAHFPPSGKTPELAFVAAPQYNTWIELTYNQNEKDILAYAQSMLDNGLPPGVFMIDDTWQTNYGVWEFDPKKFSDPKGMCDKLHKMGFKVVLWVCPWVSMDSQPYRTLLDGQDPFKVEKQPTGGFLTMDNGWEPAAVTWWNGKSALLDFTHPNGRRWFKEQLDRLVKDYGVDGFKLDGGSLDYYTKGLKSHEKIPSADQANGYLAFSLQYPVCEYRHAWKSAGQPIVERLHDKNHKWSEVQALIPSMVAGGLLGHPFICPDMIGGGNWRSFVPGSAFEPEMFVRSAQVHALCGMMQFSASPWRVLDAEKQQIIRDLVKMRQTKFAQKFVALAQACGKSGEPMIRNLEYVFPGKGYAEIKDQFMMGDFLLVAPVMEKGATSRKVVLPPGKWRADDGQSFTGPCEITVAAPLARLPYFEIER
ncbi:MAG: alpha/beta fold hydrolase [Kiritimatiellae bacterium]|nr:alpha/beta fold hydrolase [Kiritimatiellia bacterium]